MSDSLTDLIFSLAPEDGSSIGNSAMIALLRERVPSLTEDDYVAARDALVDDGLLARGRGRGGSIMRVLDETEEEDEKDWEEDDDEVNEFELTPTDELAPRQRTATGRKKVARKSDGPVQVLSYRHGETRVNNPEVGMVHAGTDPDGAKTVWAYDPHLDPVLNFDSARADIENLIDNALPNRVNEDAVEAVVAEIATALAALPDLNADTIAEALRKAIAADRSVTNRERMKDALVELRRLQAPYLNWTGKAERTSFGVDTVSLHVHERVDPATILATAAKPPLRRPWLLLRHAGWW